jgi:uncharacterized protein (DUF2236 family)
VSLFGWTRAILLQLAHPLVAAGVAEHSTFRGERLRAARRLHATVRAMLALTFGDGPARTAALDGIRAVHRRVHGTLAETVGPFPAGTPYSAEDPDLVLWVHATLLDSIPMAYARLVAPLTEGEHDAYCADAADVALALGARPHEVPATQTALQAYLDRQYASGALTVGAEARAVAATVLHPPLGAAIWPATALNRLVSTGWLPTSIRTQYGLPWNATRARRLASAEVAIRRARKLLPRRLAYWPEAR